MGTPSAEEVRKDLKKRKEKGGKKDKWFKMKEDTTTYIRLGPPVPKGGDFWVDRFFHGGYEEKVFCAKNDKDEDTGKTRKCIVERKLKEIKGDKSKFAKKLWGIINQRNEGLWNVMEFKRVETDDGKHKFKPVDGKWKIWQLSFKWHNMLVEIFAEEDYRENSELGVTDLKTGRFIKVTRTGEKLKTEYSFRVLDKEVPISKDKEERIEMRKKLNDLHEVVSGSSDEELESFLAKAIKSAKKKEDDEDDDEDEDKKKKKKKKHRDDDDDDEDDDRDEDDEDDDDDEKSSKKKKKKKDDDDDEEEDDDEEDDDSDDDDEDDESDKKKKKKKSKSDDDDDEDDDKDEDDDDDDESEEDDDEDDKKKKKKKKKSSDDDDDDEDGDEDEVYEEMKKSLDKKDKKKKKKKDKDEDDEEEEEDEDDDD